MTKTEIVHGGYAPIFGIGAGNRIIPLDAMLSLERDGYIGELDRNIYVTVGNLMPVTRAAEFGQEMAAALRDSNVTGAILTSSCGACTRCGAAIAKSIDAEGIPIVHVCTITPISRAAGANRIYPAVAIPYPTGFPETSKEREKKLRYKMTREILRTLTVDINMQTVF